MSVSEERLQRLLGRVDIAWNAFIESFAGLPDPQLVLPGVIGDWTIKDILGHITTWEEEALRHLPSIAAGTPAPRYSVTYGGIDAFNELKRKQKQALSLNEVRQQLETTHKALIDYLKTVTDSQLASGTRFRHRLRFDTYGHYPIHTDGILQWRQREQHD
jgi:hypothetical protein